MNEVFSATMPQTGLNGGGNVTATGAMSAFGCLRHNPTVISQSLWMGHRKLYQTPRPLPCIWVQLVTLLRAIEKEVPHLREESDERRNALINLYTIRRVLAQRKFRAP